MGSEYDKRRTTKTRETNKDDDEDKFTNGLHYSHFPFFLTFSGETFFHFGILFHFSWHPVIACCWANWFRVRIWTTWHICTALLQNIFANYDVGLTGCAQLNFISFYLFLLVASESQNGIRYFGSGNFYVFVSSFRQKKWIRSTEIHIEIDTNSFAIPYCIFFFIKRFLGGECLSLCKATTRNVQKNGWSKCDLERVRLGTRRNDVWFATNSAQIFPAQLLIGT